MGKTRDLFKKIGDIKGIFHTRRFTVKVRNGKDVTVQKLLRRGGKNTQKNIQKEVLVTQITTVVCSLT